MFWGAGSGLNGFLSEFPIREAICTFSRFGSFLTGTPCTPI